MKESDCILNFNLKLLREIKVYFSGDINGGGFIQVRPSLTSAGLIQQLHASLC